MSDDEERLPSDGSGSSGEETERDLVQPVSTQWPDLLKCLCSVHTTMPSTGEA